MPDIQILTETDLRTLVPLDIAAVDCVEEGFRALASGNVVMPPVLSMEIAENNGEIDAKTAFIGGADSFALKVSPGFFDNPKIGLPTTSGLMIVFSAKTGQIEALLLDNGYLTDVRTAAAGAVSARHLARDAASSVCVVGTGLQARMQLQAISLVRDIRSVVVWGRDAGKAKLTAADMAAALGIPVTADVELPAALAGADIVVTTTPARQPLIRPDWLQPGQLVIAMGSDHHAKCELDPACITRADLYVADRLSQTRTIGELRAAIDAGAVAPDAPFPELGAVVAQTALGRINDDQIIIADLTGTGIQDTAIATFARKRAQRSGSGTTFHS